MILLDHTEAREGSLLPKSVIDACVICTGLEAMTGADLLITPLKKPELTHLKDTTYYRQALQLHTTAGMLVQRKHGGDLTSSIPNLKEIQERMLHWTGGIGPWLLVVGEYTTRRGKLYIDGKVCRAPVSYAQFVGSMDAWQLRGGGVTLLGNERKIGGWLNRQHERLLNNGMGDKAFVPAQKLVLTDQWWSRLTMLPGVGEKTAEAVKDWLPREWRSLGLALCALTDDENLAVGDRPTGVGRKTLEKIREFLGLEQDEVMMIRKKND